MDSKILHILLGWLSLEDVCVASFCLTILIWIVWSVLAALNLMFGTGSPLVTKQTLNTSSAITSWVITLPKMPIGEKCCHSVQIVRIVSHSQYPRKQIVLCPLNRKFLSTASNYSLQPPSCHAQITQLFKRIWLRCQSNSPSYCLSSLFAHLFNFILSTPVVIMKWCYFLWVAFLGLLCVVLVLVWIEKRRQTEKLLPLSREDYGN